MESRISEIVKWSMMLLLFGGMSSCTLFEKDEINPTRIELNPFTFNVQSGQGTADNKITEVWVYANNAFLGAFTPPTNVYYLESGLTTFEFRPGIRNNGIQIDGIPYPLFSAYSIDLEAAPGAVFVVNPTTSYLPSTQFPFMTDFEIDNPFTDNRDTVLASNLVRSAVDAYEGSYSGQIVMSEEADFIEVGHALPISNLPVDGSPIYLEMRYKCEVEMSIGLLGTNLSGDSFSNFFYLVNPTSEWKMLYLELTDFIVASDLNSYKILFRSLYPANATKPEHNLFIDNVKVVHL